MSNNRIIWEKYENNVNKHIGISKILMTGGLIKPDTEDSDIEDFDEEDYEDQEGGMIMMRFPITPELMEGIKLSSTFDCWIGHCNFTITNEIVQKLNKMPGVEYLDILTKYRFLIGLGKAFTLTDVRGRLQEELGINTNG